MAFDVARVRGLHPTLGDGWVHLDPQAGMLIPDAVSTTVSTAFRTSGASASGPHPLARRSATLLDAARQAVADMVNGDPAGVVLGADRAVLLTLLADASSSRSGLGYEIVVTRLDDEANISPWLRAANRYGAAAVWSTITSPPASCINLLTGRRSTTVPSVEDADAIATSRVGLVIRFSHCQAGNSPVSISTSAHLTLAPYRLAALSHGAMLASSSRRVTTTS